MRKPSRMTLYLCTTVGGFLVAMFFVPLGTALAQSNLDQDLAARRQAILQQDELLTDDGQIIDQDALVMRSQPAVRPVPVRTAVAKSTDQAEVHLVRWGVRFYEPGYYYGPPRARYYARYPSYYSNPYYNNYGYRGYYGRPGYYPRYYGYPNGAARVGPMRFYW